MAPAVICTDTIGGTVATIVVGGTCDSEAEPDPGIAVIPAERAYWCEEGGGGEGHVGINIVHMIIRIKAILIVNSDVELKPSLEKLIPFKENCGLR